MIDLHLHTTASDGRSTPDALVREAAARGVRTLAVTDHDTIAGVEAVRAAARAEGLDVVAGIEITAVLDGRDVHVLGYFIDIEATELAAFLEAQRADRRRRVTEILATLDRLGLEIDAAPLWLEAGAASGKAMGRPMVARALVAAGHAKDVADAFARFLGEGQPAFVPRTGASPAEVVALIDRAGGLASIAHPIKLPREDLIAELADQGLPAIEVHHPDQDAAARGRFQRLADRLGLLVTGGSDYHGPGTGRADALGRVGLPASDYERLAARAAARGWSA